MRNIKGFTLVELLIVIVLMGMLFTIAIPSVIKLSESRSNTEYKVYRRLVEQAANKYQHRYKGDFDNNTSATCYSLDYQALLDEGLLEEDNISCTGKIFYMKNSKGYLSKRLYLNCNDRNNVNFSKYNQGDLPSGCSILGTESTSNTIKAPTIKGGSSSWVSTNVDITVDNSGIDVADVKRYEYYTANNGITPPNSVAVKTVSNSKVTIDKEGTTYIWFRVVNNSNETSGWSNRQSANIDKKTPTKPTITASDSISSGSKHTGDFVLNFGGGTNVSGNNYFYGTSESNMSSIASSVLVTSADNGKTYYVKSCSGASICSDVEHYIVKY